MATERRRDSWDRNFALNILRTEEAPEKMNRIARERKSAIQRLKKVLSDNDYLASNQDSMLSYALNTIYKYPKKKIVDLSDTVRMSLVQSAVGSDLMLRELFDELGEQTVESEALYPDLDPINYLCFYGGWSQIKEALEKSVPDENDEYAGHVRAHSNVSEDVNFDDPVARYIQKHGKGSVVVLPFSIQIDQNSDSILIVPAKSFMAPYGGPYSDRTIFFPVRDGIIPPKRSE